MAKHRAAFAGTNGFRAAVYRSADSLVALGKIIDMHNTNFHRYLKPGKRFDKTVAARFQTLGTMLGVAEAVKFVGARRVKRAAK